MNSELDSSCKRDSYKNIIFLMSKNKYKNEIQNNVYDCY